MRIHALTLVALLEVVSTSPAQAAVPGQFIAKMYTEALGRAPDATGWRNYVGNFTRDGCSVATLKANGRALYLSSEYASFGYTNAEKVLTAYRGILSREPDEAGFNSWKGLLDQGGSFASVVDSLFDSVEFRNLLHFICSGESYGWAEHPVVALLPGGSMSGTQLQAQLAAAGPGTSVYLAPGTVVFADSPIVVPAGVALATAGVPSRQKYARMARIVRTQPVYGYEGPLSPVVQLEPGARLQSVWVSGQRQRLGYALNTVNIVVRSGNGGAVLDSRSDSPAGMTALYLLGSYDMPISCANVTVSNNLLTGYTSHHSLAEGGGWADGISNACEGALVKDNHIVDASDVGIVVYRSHPAVQRSLVTNNIIVAAGLSAYSALAVDPLSGTPEASFNGSLVSSNQFWAAPTTHFDIGISVGTLAWGFPNAVVGTGASVRDNTTAGISTNMDSGIFIDGMLNATVQGNLLLRNPLEVSQCPSGNVLADVAGGQASGNLQSWTQGNAFARCVGH